MMSQTKMQRLVESLMVHRWLSLNRFMRDKVIGYPSGVASLLAIWVDRQRVLENGLPEAL